MTRVTQALVFGATGQTQTKRYDENGFIKVIHVVVPAFADNPTVTFSVIDNLGNTVWTDSGAPRVDGTTYLLESLNIPIERGYTLKAYLSVNAGVGGGTIDVNSFVDTGSRQNVMLPAAFINSVNFKHQADSILNQAAPVQNTWYTVLDTVVNARLIGLGILIADTGETLEVRLTVDGNIIIGSGAAVAGTDYHAMVHTHATGTVLTFSSTDAPRAFMLEGRSLKVEVRKTTAAGAGNLKACAAYETRG
jgi:hypothetical protein